MNTIELAEQFLKENIKDTYRVAHSYRVANIGKIIAQNEGLDVEDTIIACLLHDIAYRDEFKTQEDWMNHGRKSARIVREFLKKLDFSEQRIHDICFAIAIHVDLKADFEGEYTTFAQTIQEADNIDRVGVYRLYETLEAVQFSKRPLEVQIQYVEDMIKTLNEYLTYELSTSTAASLWKNRVEFQLDYYNRLKNQFNISQKISVQD